MEYVEDYHEYLDQLKEDEKQSANTVPDKKCTIKHFADNCREEDVVLNLEGNSNPL